MSAARDVVNVDVSIWRDTGEMAFIRPEGTTTKPALLARKWVELGGEGRVEWRRYPLVLLSEEEYDKIAE